MNLWSWNDFFFCEGWRGFTLAYGFTAEGCVTSLTAKKFVSTGKYGSCKEEWKQWEHHLELWTHLFILSKRYNNSLPITDTSSITTDDDSLSHRASHMSPDSEDGYDLVRTLRHYRRRRRRSSDSSTTDSNCSCESCVSKTNKSFFDSEEGPPGGETTIYRRAALWMDSMKYL